MNNHIRDIDIREKLLSSKYIDTKSCNTLVIEELGILWGQTIVDVAVVNGNLHAFEIKSQVDSLDRFERQYFDYNQVFDYTTILLHEKHLRAFSQRFRRRLSNWGVIVVSGSRDNISLKIEKEPKKNPKTNLYSTCHFLWKDESLDLLRKYGFSRGLCKKSKQELYQILCKELPQETLRTEIRECLKARANWRVPATVH